MLLLEQSLKEIQNSMKISSRSYLIKAILVVMACAMFALAAVAQSTTDGAIAGMVTDQSKAVVVNAKITAHNVGTNADSSVVTDAQGHFRVIKLQPGTYSVTIAAKGFASYTQPAVIVEVGLVTNIEFALAVAGSKETVEVTAEAPTVNTEQQDFNTNINQQSINNLPINGRRWSNFALLTPGATPDGGFGLISFRGISGLMNSMTVDGGDNSQAFFSEERGRTRIGYTVSQASIREFQVNTSNYSAEYGRAAGGVVNSVTKTGTNSIHGEAFYYIRDNTLGATNPFTKTYVKNDTTGGYDAVPFKPEDRRHQFGGNLGGALLKDKLFYFFNYDGQRRNFPGVGIPGSPSFLAPAASSDLSTLTSNLGLKDIAGGLTAAQQAQNYYSQGLAFLASETGAVPRTGDQDIFFPKFDWIVNNKNTFTASYNRMRWASPAGVQTQPTVAYGIGSFGNDFVKTDMVNAKLTSIITNNITNELRYSWGRDLEIQNSQFPSAAEANPCSVMGSPAGCAGTLATSLMPGESKSRTIPIYFSGNSGISLGRLYYGERAAYPDETRNQFADIQTWVHGKHLLKYGLDLVRNNDLYNNLYEGPGEYSYSNRTAFISDLMRLLYPTAGLKAGKQYSTYYQSFGNPAIEFHTWDVAGFLQDDWKVLPRLTLNIGVRYEFEKLPRTQYPNFDIAQTETLPADHNNYGPRVGFAWDVFGDGKTAIRGGYGMYYGRLNNGLIGGALFQTGVTGTQTNYSLSYSSACAPVFPNPLTAQPGSSCSVPTGISYLDSHIQNPQIHQADFILEQQIAKNTMLSVSYLLSMGRELPNFVDTNLAPTSTMVTYKFSGGPMDGQTTTVPFYTARLNPKYAQMIDGVSNVNSSYNALVAQLNRRMTNGLQFQMSYTWSHSLDQGQNSTTQISSSSSAVFDPYRQGLEYGTSNFDIRQRFVGSVVWQPQFFQNKSGLTKAVFNGWSIAPLLQFSTGRPYTEGISGTGSSYALINGSSPTYLDGGYNNAGGGRLAYVYNRNSWRYPMLQNIDLRLSRQFKLTERQKFEVVAEAFNLFNHEQITGIANTMYFLSGAKSATPTFTYEKNQAGYTDFGGYTQGGTNMFRERQIQFAVRYSF